MKKILAIMVLGLGMSLNAQINIGLKGGLIFPASGDIKTIGSQIGDIYQSKGESKTGYQMGIFTRINIPVFNLFLQPELLYSSVKESFYTGTTTKGSLVENQIAKIDIPLLVGISFLKYINIKAGPVLSYNLKNDLKTEAANLSNIQKEDFNLAAQLGAGISFKHWDFDLRYERSLSTKETTFVQGNTLTNSFSIDNRPNSIIASIGYKF